MLNKIFWSKKAHRVLTVMFLLSLIAYVSLFVTASHEFTQTEAVRTSLAIVAAYYYDMFYGCYFIVRFIWRIFNKPDINQYEIDKRTMPRDKFMRKYGVYRY